MREPTVTSARPRANSSASESGSHRKSPNRASGSQQQKRVLGRGQRDVAIGASTGHNRLPCFGSSPVSATLAVGRECKRPSTSTRAPLRSRLAGGFSARPGADTAVAWHEDPRSADVPQRLIDLMELIMVYHRTQDAAQAERFARRVESNVAAARYRQPLANVEKALRKKSPTRYKGNGSRHRTDGSTGKHRRKDSKKSCPVRPVGKTRRGDAQENPRSKEVNMLCDGRNGRHDKAHNFFGDTSGLTKSTKEKHAYNHQFLLLPQE